MRSPRYPCCRPFPAAIVLLCFAFLWRALAEPPAPLTPAAMEEAAREAYIYGYPLVTMEITRRVMTNVDAPQGGRAPAGFFAHRRDRLGQGPGQKGPMNPDLLFSSAWLDLSGEPYVLTIPDVKKRYFLLTLLDGWTNVVGTLSAPGGRILISGPGWQGGTPEGMREFKCLTDFAWLIAQFGIPGTTEKEIHMLQDQLVLTPLSKYENPYLYVTKPPRVDPGIDMATPIREQVSRLTPAAYFGILAQLLKRNYPVSDGGIFQRLKRIGFIVGHDFDLLGSDEDPKPDVSAPPKEAVKAFSEAPEKGLALMKKSFFESCLKENGWIYATESGECRTNYALRAALARYGLGAGRAADFMTAETQVDSRGRPLEGRYRYRVHLGSVPPVKAFWTLGTVDHQGNLVPNDAGRYSIGSGSRGSGTVDLLVQRSTPGGGNWLPAPEGRFALVLRLYRPLPAARDGSWRFPVVERIE